MRAAPWSPIQAADLPAQHFDAALSWGMMFHLNCDEQSHAVAVVAGALKPGGRFLFTSGDPEEDGPDGVEGTPMNGVPFHYWSFTRESYRDLLKQCGLTLLEVHRGSGDSTDYLAVQA